MKILIFGVGNNADLAYYYLTNDSEYEIVAFVLETDFIKENTKFGLPIVDLENIKKKYNPSEYSLFAPCDYSKLNKYRERIYNKGKQMGYNFISYISSKANVFTNDIGENCFIFEDTIIQPYTKIGNNCILWSGATVCHHSVIEDFVFIASNAVIAGYCLIKKYSFIGINSSIRDCTTIEENTVVGMHSCVTKNTKSYNIYIGCPAKILKKCDDTVII